MARFKWWLILGGIFVVGLACALTAAVWNSISSEWSVEYSAAEYALNHSPIDRIQRHDVFTAAGAQEVFYGIDPFGQPWYVFVYGTPFSVQVQSAKGVMTAAKAAQTAKQDGLHVISEHIGYLDSTAAATFHTNAGAVWEVYGQTSAHKHAYLYLDATTGKSIWKYVLST